MAIKKTPGKMFWPGKMGLDVNLCHFLRFRRYFSVRSRIFKKNAWLTGSQGFFELHKKPGQMFHTQNPDDQFL
ncbi:MAG: hypothetical protein WC342_03965 [Methanoregula sp.]